MSYNFRRKNMKNQRVGGIRRLLIPAAAVILLFCISPARAHKVTVFAWVEGDQVFCESKMSGGKRVAAGEITVYDATRNVLLKGKTSDQGAFSFKLPQPPPLTIELNAGMGHQATWTIKPDDVDDAVFPTAGKGEKGVTAPLTVSKPLYDDPPGELNTAELETVIEKVLDKKLKPLMRLLADTQQKDPSLTDIIGGIGYIMGIVGIIAYFKSRQNN
jgi:nickel transport protein